MTDKLSEFLPKKKEDRPEPEGMEFFATVQCQSCGESVGQQTYFHEDKVLVWKCSAGHRSMMENFSVF